jgi:hypothetical protein
LRLVPHDGGLEERNSNFRESCGPAQSFHTQLKRNLAGFLGVSQKSYFGVPSVSRDLSNRQLWCLSWMRKDGWNTGDILLRFRAPREPSRVREKGELPGTQAAPEKPGLLGGWTAGDRNTLVDIKRSVCSLCYHWQILGVINPGHE